MTDTNQKLREALQAISHIDDTTNHSVDASAALDRIGQIARQALALPTADHIPDAGEMVNGLTKAETDASASVSGLTAAPVGERERFESWWRSVQLMTFPKEYAIKRLQDWGSIYKPKALDAWQAALSAGDAVDAQRLDFIEKSARCDPKMDGQHVWWPTSLNKAIKGPTLRAAIDAAMAARAKGGAA